MNMQDHQAIEQLQKSGNYRILQRLQAPDVYFEGQADMPRIGLVVDTETTGLDTEHDQIIELGFVAFEYDASSGKIYRILHTYDGFEDPKQPLSELVKELTGIDDAMVKNQRLDDDEINPWIEKSSLLIAHNAAFDRRMMERRLPQVKGKAWACSFADLDWQEEGIASRKLDYIAYQMGYFFDGHRAVNDAQATLHLLAQGLPKSKKYAMGELLRIARKPKLRIFALAAPFDKKDALKERGYRWLADFLNKNGKKGVWSLLIEEDAREAEETWLREEIYTQKSPMFQCKTLTAKNRYSVREFALS
ncbi:MAG: 3'-5' exonuclease [Mariprofundaceae bacterium]|nr:3'-5' exonuclease [Mariprofundaceae bacterium]